MANLIMGTQPEGHPEAGKMCPCMRAAGTYLLLLTLEEPDPVGKYSCQLCPFIPLRGGEARGHTSWNDLCREHCPPQSCGHRGTRLGVWVSGWGSMRRTDIKVTWCWCHSSTGEEEAHVHTWDEAVDNPQRRMGCGRMEGTQNGFLEYLWGSLLQCLKTRLSHCTVLPWNTGWAVRESVWLAHIGPAWDSLARLGLVIHIQMAKNNLARCPYLCKKGRLNECRAWRK